LRRKTLADALARSERLADFAKNPQRFMDEAAKIVNGELKRLAVEGIQYEHIAGEEYEMTLFKDKEFSAYLNDLLPSRKSVYERIPYDSDIEKRFAEELERKEHVKLYVKLPSWFTVDTPVGTYNPDWAIVKENDEKVYFVRETKGGVEEHSLRLSESQKIACGKKHFEAIGMNDFEVVKDASGI
jgi:type III restriction enzyme